MPTARYTLIVAEVVDSLKTTIKQIIMSKNVIKTSNKVAKVASRKLTDPKADKKTKTLAGSALVNTKKHN